VRDPARERADYSLVSRSTITSEVLCARITASVLPSGDQRNPVITSEVKFVVAAGFGLYSLLTRAGPQPFRDFTVTQITNTGKAEMAAISPDGKYILHVQNENGMRSLRLRNILTGSDTQIVAPAPFRYRALVFSPDGNYVYFRQLTNSAGSSWDVYRLPVLGGTPQLIASDVDSDIIFSPDTRRISYVRANDGKYRLLTANPDGTAVHCTIMTVSTIM
jgi:hypothetical protein